MKNGYWFIVKVSDVLKAMEAPMTDFTYLALERIGGAIEGLFMGFPGSVDHGVWKLYSMFWSGLMEDIQFELSEGLLTRSRPRTEAEVR